MHIAAGEWVGGRWVAGWEWLRERRLALLKVEMENLLGAFCDTVLGCLRLFVVVCGQIRSEIRGPYILR